MTRTATGGRGGGRRLWTIIGSILVGVVAAEGAMWVLPRSWLPDHFTLLDRVYTARSGWHRMMTGDAFLGYKLKPDLDIMFPSEGRGIPVRTLNYGLGDVGFRDIGTKPPFAGVAIGGSFTLCDDVPAERCWVRLLSESTGRSLATLGVNGYSTLASARMLERYGRRLMPKFVLVDVFLNDFKDNLNFDRWARSGSTDFWAWLRERRGRSELDRFLSEHSMVYRVFDGAIRARGRRIYQYREGALDLVFRVDGWWLQLVENPQGTPAWGLMEGALRQIGRTARDIDAVPVVLLFPMKEEIYWDAIQSLAPDLAGIDVSGPFDAVRELAARQGMASCDLRGALHRAASEGKQVYHRISSHWNDEGNRVAAGAIEECLRDRGLIGATHGS